VFLVSGHGASVQEQPLPADSWSRASVLRRAAPQPAPRASHQLSAV